MASVEVLRDAAYQAGFRGADIDLAVAVAMAESGGQEGATGTIAPGEYSVGPWQINMSAHSRYISEQAARDPYQAAKYAYHLVNNTPQGWNHWSAYSQGTYRPFLSNPAAAQGFSAQGASMPPLTPQELELARIKVAQDYGVKNLNDVIVMADGTIVVMGSDTYDSDDPLQPGDQAGQPVPGTRGAIAQVYATRDASGGVGYTYEKPASADPTKAPNLQTSSLPVGYTFDPQSGQFYRNGQPVSAEEVQQAAMREQAMGRAPSTNEFQISPQTGDLVMLDPVTGQMRTVANGFGYPEVSPWQQRQDQMFGIQEGARQADNSLAYNYYNTQESGRQADNSFNANIYGTQESGRQADNRFRADIYGTQESGRQSDNTLAVQLYGIRDDGSIRRAQLGQKDVIDRATLMEQARQANLEAALRQFETRASLIPQFGQLALAESDAQRQILSQGGDFLYRAFRSQGEDSPLPLVTQADLIGHLRNQLGQLDNIIPAEALQTGTTRIDGFQIPGAAKAPTMKAAAKAPTPARMAAAPTAAPMKAPPAITPMSQPKLMGQTTTFTPTAAASGAQIYVPDNAPAWVKAGLVSQYAEGTGFTVEPQFITGDPKPGKKSKPNPEMIYNPTHAPIAVVPMDRMPPRATPVRNQARTAPAQQPQQRQSGFTNPLDAGSMVGGRVKSASPKLYSAMQSWWQSPMMQQWLARRQRPMTPPANRFNWEASIPAFATGTGAYSAPAQSYSYPTTQPTPLPDYFQKPAPTQQQLVQAADATLPPAIRSIMQGGAPKQRGFDFNLPTLRQLSMLTDEELKAFDTYSRVKYQTPLADTYREIQQRYAPTAAGFTYRPSFMQGIGI